MVISGNGGDVDDALKRMDQELSDHELQVIRGARKAISVGSVEEGAVELADLSGARDLGDPALRSAAALIAAVSLAEVDRHRDAVDVIQNASSLIDGSQSDGRLLLGALKQQEALRALEAGVEWRLQRSEAKGILASVRVPELSVYVTSLGARWNARLTNQNMLRALRESNTDLFNAEIGFPSAAELRRLLKEMSPLASSHLLTERSGATAFIDESFARFVMSADRTIRNRDPVDQPVWRSQTYFELVGNRGQARARRRNLGQLRLMRSPRLEVASFSEGLRLLRQSGDTKLLRLAHGLVRSGGPLLALVNEVETIVENRLLPTQLRAGELATLEAGAQLLSLEVASTALTAVFAAMDAMPIAFDLQREISSVHFERLAKSAAALAPVAGRVDDLAAKVLDLVDQLGATSDELLVRAMAVAVSNVDWSETSRSIRDRWTIWLSDAAGVGGWSPLVNLLSPLLMQDEPDAASVTDSLTLERVGHELNAVIGGVADPPYWLRDPASELVEARLREIRQQAANGVFSGYVSDAADLGVALVHLLDADLWDPVTDYLLDSRVPRSAKSDAFLRIASRPEIVPPAIRETFGRNVNELLNATSFQSPFDPPAVDPDPAAVRLFTALGIYTSTDALEAVASLASAGTRERLEACRILTTVLLSSEHAPEWGVSMAIQLSTDPNENVRAETGRNLALALQRSTFATDVLERRLFSLLEEDGILVPLLALRGLSDETVLRPGPLRDHIELMAEQHLVFGVRIQARSVLGHSAPPR
ncbi:hypothetical protein ACIRON_17990 [Nocardioides sp. NPDC101246]|uniref:hypothetical protein n=1 Tax=Nocardioides sp. NPDC101246 TaxID=3364336 RepID=UPI003824249F